MSVTFSNNKTDLNVSNSNYRTISQALGIFNDNYYGEIAPATLVQACKEWQSKLQFDAGVDFSIDDNIFDCGRRRGYLNIKVQQLLELAQEAISLGVEEIWFG